MAPVLILLEIAFLTTLVCAVHRLRHRLGVAPLFMLIGLFEAFLFFVGKSWPPMSSEFFFVEPRGIYLLFLPTILVSAVIVYTLDGTRAARQFMVGLVILYIAHGALDLIVEYHGTHPPPGEESLADSALLWYSNHSRLAALVAMCADFVVVIVVFQFVRNRMPRIPLALPLFVGLVAAMVCDAVVFKLIKNGALSMSILFIGAKAQAGAAAGLPAALYVAWMLRHQPISDSTGLERGAFEIIDLRRQVTEMRTRLKEQRAQYLYIKDSFRRYVSPDVVDAILEDPTKLKLGGELRDVSVLFADIEAYSTFSERLDPTEIIELLNQYFAAVSEVILGHQGMINEFEGDAVLAVFGAPLDLEDHALRAVQVGVQMLQVVEALNETWAQNGMLARLQSTGVDAFRIRIGVHSGPVVAGNVGSEARTKYAVIGDTVNTAARVEGLNKVLETRLLISGTTVDLLGEHPIVDALVDQGDHSVKGRSERVQVFTVDERYSGES